MGRSWEDRKKGGGKPPGSGGSRWGYWHGAYSPNYRGRGQGQDSWQDEETRPQPASFPAYDSKDRAAAFRKEQQAKTWKTGEDSLMRQDDPQETMTNDLQDHINVTRRSEQRVRNLMNAKEKKERLWLKYQEEMKQTLQRESQRHAKAMEHFDKDLAAAVSAREEARSNLRLFFQRGGEIPPMDDPPGEDWSATMEAWRKETQEQETPQAVLQRAFQSRPPTATGLGHPALGSLMTPEAAARLLEATILSQGLGHGGRHPLAAPSTHGPGMDTTAAVARTAEESDNRERSHPVAPYVSSPSHPRVEPPPTSSPTSAPKASPATRTRPRQPIKGAPLQPVHTQQTNTLSTKLEAKRQALAAEQAATPSGTLANPEHQDGTTRPAVQSLVDDDDEDLKETHTTDTGRDGHLDGLG
ncbi:unnamed protein product [Symbiodinium sp. CCMP2592]|nr:unnamed protein product [Symbiodinium sp. CCMP2592]